MKENGKMDTASFGYEFIQHSLTEALTEELFSYVTSKLTSSSLVLEERSRLISSMKRESAKTKTPDWIDENDLSLTERLDIHLNDLQDRIDLITSQVEPEKAPDDRKDSEIYTLSKQINYLEQKKTALKEQKEVFYLIAPINTTHHKGIRVVMPIDAKSEIPAESLLDYIYTAFNAELAIPFQQSAFGEVYLDDIVQVSTSTLKEKKFHAVDIIYDFEIEELDNILATVAQFTTQLFTSPKAHFEERGMELDDTEMEEANVVLKPLIFPFNYPAYVKEYLDTYVADDLSQFADEFKKFLLTEFKGYFDEHTKERLNNEPLSAKIFELDPYLDSLESLTEKHKEKLLQMFYKDVLQTEFHQPEYTGNGNGHTTHPTESVKWIKKADAVKAFFVAAKQANAETTYDNAVEVGLLNTKQEDGEEYVMLDDLLILHEHVITQGRSVMGVYDEPVITTPQFAKQHGLDNKILNQMIIDDTIPHKDIKRRKDGTPMLYILRKSDTEEVIRIYYEHN
ncbi:hypothetical protein ACFL96_03525 [Thermoproteota archaeon]